MFCAESKGKCYVTQTLLDPEISQQFLTDDNLCAQ